MTVSTNELLELNHDQRVAILVEKYKSRPWIFANNVDEIEARTLLMQIIDIKNNEALNDTDKTLRVDQLIERAIKDMALKESIEVNP